MKRSILILLGYLTVTFSSQAQDGPGTDWNWPEDPALHDMAKEKQAYYKIQLLQENYEGSLATLNWLYTNTGDLNPSIYKDGAKSIEGILDKDLEKNRKSQLEDSLLWMYDQRIKHFDEDANVLDRKAYTAFKLFYKTPSKYATVLDIYKKAFEVNGTDISYFNLTPYVTLASYYYKTNPAEMPLEGVLEVYDQVSYILDEQIKQGNAAKLEKERNKIDAILSSFGDIINCDFIQDKFVVKFNEDPTNVALAKKIFSYSLKAKCSDQPYFLKTGEVVYKEAPTYALAKALGDKFYADKQYDKALTYYESAADLAETDENKSQALLNQASVYTKQGKKTSARSKAYEVIKLGKDVVEGYNIIGNLYFTSYEDCRKGESKVADRTSFIAAHKMYKLAGNTQQMTAAKEQFPSIEELFSENYEEGQEINTGCWIGESVTLERR